MVRILLVDDDPDSLQNLRQVLEVMRDTWTMDFAANGPEAIGLVQNNTYDIVVTDNLSGSISGLEVLAKFTERQPEGIRFMLSGEPTKESSVHLAGSVHQQLLKPCDPGELRDAVLRAIGLRDVLTNSRLQSLVSRMQALPSMPSVYLDLVDELRREDPSPEAIGRIISRDMGMCAKMLQLVNSAFFGLLQPVTKPEEAVMFLGLDTVKALVFSLQIFALFGRDPSLEAAIDQLWKHSWRTGKIAQRLCGIESPDKGDQADQAMTCGLLHDVGKLVLRTGLGAQYRGVLALTETKKISVREAELEVFGSSHAEVGAYLLGLWGLPNPIVEAVAFHHQPVDGPNSPFNLVIAIHAANLLDHEMSGQAGPVRPEDLEYLTRMGLAERYVEWRRIISEVSRVRR
ncbi:MAG: HDOD domain-containing protein [Opitutaceae bacterium]|nr:HDOD domain-containing protein [Verrucomicrobiales bacterium]